MNYYQAVYLHFVSQIMERWFHLKIIPSKLEEGDLFDLIYTDWSEVEKSILVSEQFNSYKKLKEYISENKREIRETLNEHFTFLRERDGDFISILDSRYPKYLRHISDPPLGFSVIGDKKLLQNKKFAIVGSRKASGFSMCQAENLAKDLSKKGYVIVSGGAFGCDSGAHAGALQSNINPCPTIAVFAGGLNTLYPKTNKALFKKIFLKKGLFLSEKIWNAPYRPRDYPIRNRIISGLSQGVILIQAAQKSGAMITANFALDQGRDLFVLQQDEIDVRASGNHFLAEQGATLIENYSDVLCYIGQ